MDITLSSTNMYGNTPAKADKYETKTAGSKKHESIEDVFRRFDAQTKQIKEEDKEYYERLEKYRKEQEKLKREQKQRLAAKQALVEKTGMLWTSGLTDESKQVLMQKSPGLMAKYRQNEKTKNDDKKERLSELV